MAEPRRGDIEEVRHLRERQREIERRIHLLELRLGIIHPTRIHVIPPPPTQKDST